MYFCIQYFDEIQYSEVFWLKDKKFWKTFSTAAHKMPYIEESLYDKLQQFSTFSDNTRRILWYPKLVSKV